MYDSINVYIARSLSEGEDIIKEVISTWTNNLVFIPVDSRCRSDNNKYTKSELSIVLINDYFCDRYTADNKYNIISKNIYLNSDEALFLIYTDNKEQYSKFNDVICLNYNSDIKQILNDFHWETI